jgi:hypothetical protein
MCWELTDRRFHPILTEWLRHTAETQNGQIAELFMTFTEFNIRIPVEYQPHPQEDPVLQLVEEIKTYPIPDHYETLEYVETRAVAVTSIQKPGKANVGRFRGISKTSYDTVDRSMSKGWKFGKRPPSMLEGEDWLLNGNHRLRWYKENGYSWMPVDVFRLKSGFSTGDAIDEIGLLHQPKPEGTAACFEDYKARGILFVERKKNEGVEITPELVNAWVDKYAANETKLSRTNLKKAIFNNTGQSAFLSSVTRNDAVDLLVLEKGFVIRESDYKLEDGMKVVHRLYEASQKVFLRDFLPIFFDAASKGIKTTVHFYVTTSNVKDGNDLRKVVETRKQEVYRVISSLEVFNSENSSLRDYLEFGYRIPQICGMDGDELVKL